MCLQQSKRWPFFYKMRCHRFVNYVKLERQLGLTYKETMACRLSTAAVLLQFSLLVLMTFTVDGFTLDDRLKQLTENYIGGKIKEVLAEKDVRLEALELKVQEQELKVIRLEGTVQHQEQLIFALQKQKTPSKSSAELISSSLVTANDQQRFAGRSSLFPRTCREVHAVDPSLGSGMHWIDPDGQGAGDDPIYVYCDMNKGSTSIVHDSEASIDVGHCPDPGCYSRTINYNATMRQMNALADLSSECHQSIQYDCNYAPFVLNDITYSWWNDNQENLQTFWAGGNASVHTCQCGIDHNCVDATTTCNCDSTAPVPLTDSGVITDKSYLPITRLNFGRTQLQSSSGVHTLGRFVCSGQVAVSGMPKSCKDLWLIGHSLSGLYSVTGSTQVESVYCDFTKLPADSGFETRLGYVDVKSSPVYFYVQRNSGFSTRDVPIPFELERLNVGGAMNLGSGIFTAPKSGTYFFSFSGISFTAGGTPAHIDLCVNENRIGIGDSQTSYSTLSLQSTLHLSEGDKVSLRIVDTDGLLYDTGAHFSHFTGWLLHEDLSF